MKRERESERGWKDEKFYCLRMCAENVHKVERKIGSSRWTSRERERDRESFMHFVMWCMIKCWEKRFHQLFVTFTHTHRCEWVRLARRRHSSIRQGVCWGKKQRVNSWQSEVNSMSTGASSVHLYIKPITEISRDERRDEKYRVRHAVIYAKRVWDRQVEK